MIKNVLLLIVLLIAASKVWSTLPSKWEFKHPLSQENYEDLYYYLDDDFDRETKIRTVYFFDDGNFSYYKRNKVIFRLRSTLKDSGKVHFRTDVKFRDLSSEELDYFYSIKYLSKASHKIKCENDMVLGRRPLSSCTVRYDFKTEGYSGELVDLFTSCQFYVARDFLSRFRGIKALLDSLNELGPIFSTAHEFSKDKHLFLSPKVLSTHELDMEKWTLGNKSIYEASIKTDIDFYDETFDFFESLVEEYGEDLETMSTKTKWAFEIFEANGGRNQ